MCRYVATALLLHVAGATAGYARGGFLRSSKLSASKKGKSLTSIVQSYPFYHTTEGIHHELAGLAANCQGRMRLESVSGTGASGDTRSIDVVTIRAPGSSPSNRNFVLFGEHPRELISAESGLHLVRSLCGAAGPALARRAQRILADNEYKIVVNGNPESRKRVEAGDSCLRTNPAGVDLNRNWDEKWQKEATLDSASTNPGPEPFSEPETRVFKSLVEAYQPTTFLTVHSGTRGMYMPWAYDMEHLAQRNQPEMMTILRNLDKDHCQCPFGAAGKEVGYSCPGTCLDWVYDKLKTPYAFAFEIYTDASATYELRQRWQEKMQAGGAFYQTYSHLGDAHFREVFAGRPSSFVQLNRTRGAQDGLDDGGEDQGFDEWCFDTFNPGTQSDYNSVVENWSGAYLDMSTAVAAKLRNRNSSLSF